uniref:NADH dehydrogenase subunit 4L n=3 Tax=Corallina TaxID=35169 RepID=A0A6M3W9E9_COROI|nr:NADH dehydrogenase subunit 4L [Corallina officinalis]QJF58198.1 NADH dehydrogenase subunit 4L [Corallina officinalis]
MSNMLTQANCITISTFLFLISILGIFLNQKNILIMLMSLEMMFLSVSFNFIFLSIYLDDLLGQIFALLILTVAAAESSIGLAILVVYYRIRSNITVELMSLTKG